MASFIEQATLKVNDQSSAAIAKINAELRKLQATARSLRSTTINLRVNAQGIAQATAQLRALQNMARQAGATRINLHVNTSGIAQAQAQINRLHAAAARPIAPPGGGGARGAGGGGGGGGGAARRALRQTGVQYQMGNFPILRGAASAVVGGTAYAIAANVAKTALHGVLSSEDARMRLRQSGFDQYYPGTKKKRTDDLTPETDFIMAMARKAQDEFNRIPAAAIADASVEQLNAIKANKGSTEDMQVAMKRIARNAQIMGMTFKDSGEGGESARQLERVSQALGHDVDDAKIKEYQEEAMRAIIATGGEMKAAEMVRVIQQLGPSIAKTMSARAVGDIMQMRDEGGKASTGEWRVAVQEFSRDSLNKKDKEAMAKYGLRKKHGLMDPAVTKAAATDLIGATETYIKPILEKAGLYNAESAVIAGYLDKNVGFTTSAARGITDIITSLRSGEIDRMRKQRAAVNLDPHLGDKTFRGGSDRFKASFETALARNLDKMGGAFSEEIKPFSVAMDKAGKAAEKGQYGEATSEMAKGITNMMGGPVGAILTTLATANAASTLLDPRATMADRGGAMLIAGSSALLSAAGLMARYFGGGDPNKELEQQQKQQTDLSKQIESYKGQIKDLDAKGAKGRTNEENRRLENLRRNLMLAEYQRQNNERDILAAQTRADIANKTAADAKKEEEDHFERMKRESGLGVYPPDDKDAAAAAKKSVIPDAALKTLQQIGAKKLAGVKSVTDLLKTLDQPTSIKAREDLAKQLGYTGKLGSSAAMNTFILEALKKLAAAPVEPPVKPPEPPVKPAVEPPPVELPEVEVTPSDKVNIPDADVTITDPAVKPGAPTPTTPTVQPPSPPSVAPSPTTFTPISFSSIVDPASIAGAFGTVFSDAATTIGASGSQIGTNAASTLSGAAGGIGSTIGSTAAGIISAATVNVNVNVTGAGASGGSGGSPGPTPTGG